MARRLLAACLLGMLVLSGCGGSPEDPPRTATSSPSPTKTTPPVPELPETAKADTDAGIQAFARHFVEALNHAAETNSTSAVSAASLSRCKACKSVISRLEALDKAGGEIVGGSWTITGLETSRPGSPPPGAAPAATAVIQVRASAQIVRQPGRDDQHYPAGTSTQVLLLSFEDEVWKVASWDVR